MKIDHMIFEGDQSIHHSLEYPFELKHHTILSQGNDVDTLLLHHQGDFKGLIIHFHGNAKNLTSHITHVDWLPAHGYDVLLFDYAGYGKSPGTSSRQTLVQNGIDILKYAQENLNTSREIIVLGQSLGATIATVSVEKANVPIKALILDSAFTSYRDIFGVLMKKKVGPLAPLLLPLLVSKGYDLKDSITKIKAPILLMHGEEDQLVPCRFSTQIKTMLPASELWIETGKDHCESFRDREGDFRERFLNYLRQL